MTPDPRIHVTLDHLRDLEGRARDLSFLPRQASASVLNGRHASRLRGRGLNFEEMRDYAFTEGVCHALYSDGGIFYCGPHAMAVGCHR